MLEYTKKSILHSFILFLGFFSRALFPCGDGMVCIIDDREDVWHFSPNLVHVKPYRFFQGTADINAPPGLTKTEGDDKPIIHRVRRVSQSSTNSNEEESKGDTKKETDKDKENKENIEEGENSSPDKDKSEDKVTNFKENMETSSSDIADKTAEPNKEETMDTSSGDMAEPSKKDKENTGNDVKKVEADVKEGTEKSGKQSNAESEKAEDSQKISAEDSQKSSEQSRDGEDDAKVTKDSEKSKQSLEEQKLEEGKENKETQKSSKQSRDGEGDGKVTKGSEKSEQSLEEKKLEEGKENKENQEEELIEWDDEDDYLFYLEEILKTIHKTFYTFYDSLKEKEVEQEREKPNLKNIIPYIKKKVLKGCNIMFSGVIPTNMSQEKSRAYIVAKSLGANVHQELRHKGNEKDPTNYTTHLVAARSGTSKVRTVMKYKGVKIVNPDWLWSCSERWERVEEVLFPLSADPQETGRDSPDPSQHTKKKNLKRKHGKDGKHGKEKRQKTKQTDSSDTGDSDSVDMEDEAEVSQGGDNDVTKKSEKGKETFSMTYNPMLAFSDDDLAFMDKEVDDEIADEEDPSSEDEGARDERIRGAVLKCQGDFDVSSSEDSMNADMPRGWGKKTSPRHSSDDERKGSSSPEELGPEYESETDQDKFDKIMDAFGPETENSDEEYQDSVGSVDDEIADAVLKEFLS